MFVCHICVIIIDGCKATNKICKLECDYENYLAGCLLGCFFSMSANGVLMMFVRKCPNSSDSVLTGRFSLFYIVLYFFF